MINLYYSEAYWGHSLTMNGPHKVVDNLIKSLEQEKINYAINEEKLREQGGLHKRVIAQVKENAKNTKTTYGIYPTQYDQDYVYCVAYSSIVQEK